MIARDKYLINLVCYKEAFVFGGAVVLFELRSIVTFRGLAISSVMRVVIMSYFFQIVEVFAEMSL